jgi:hypothetical protein
VRLEDFYKSGLPMQCLYEKKLVTAYRTKRGMIQIAHAHSQMRFWINPDRLELPKPLITELQHPQVLETRVLGQEVK